jgi:penicillin amidase
VLHHFIADAYSKAARDAYWATWSPRAMVLEDLVRGELGGAEKSARRALDRAGRPFALYRTWGNMHRLRLAHPFGHIPLFGARHILSDSPAAGSSDTVHVTAHGVGARRHAAVYGIGGRHISDLSDPDRNDFILLGGQDGWIGSANFDDQVPLWREGTYLRVPLRPDTARVRFPHRTELLPASAR